MASKKVGHLTRTRGDSILSPNSVRTLLLRRLLPRLWVASERFDPFGIHFFHLYVRRQIIALRTLLPICHRPPHPQVRPRVAVIVGDVEILVARTGYRADVVQRGPRPDGVDAARFVVLVPAAAVLGPDGVLDPLGGGGGLERLTSGVMRSGRGFYFLHVLVELVCDVLSGHPAADILVLHLLDDLQSVFRDGVQGAHDAAILNGP